ncbi:MAG: glutamate racemase [Buchnera aphidicola (Chaetogeoica yunlongensis)]
MFKKNIHLKHKTQKKSYIVIFDSGFGGLSIYKTIKKKYPYINYIYIFDNKNFPYGEKQDQFILAQILKIITAIKKKIKIKMVILACNTVTITSLITLKNYFRFPIIGISPDFIKAINTTKNKVIGLLGTKITINHYHVKYFIKLLSPKYTIKPFYNNKLVKIAENKLITKSLSIKKLKTILQPLLLLPNIPDTIILGCTHFSFLKKEIKKIFFNKINIIDSNISIPKHISKTLMNNSNNFYNRNIAMFSQQIINSHTILTLLKKYDFKKFQKLIL